MLKNFVKDFAKSMEVVDKILPPAKNARSGEEYEKNYNERAK